ncbi:hypothetical protein L7F22_059544 [Adiantum nelumboides]|nr:hypothetical protein [Adiantum nelumboides]
MTCRQALMQAALPNRLPIGARKIRVAAFSALDCVKLQHGPLEHPSAIRMIMRLAIELTGKTYDLSASSNARYITKPLADGCSKGPRCVFTALDYVKSQCGPFKHPSASRLVMRLALELASKSYNLSASSYASRITKRIADGCSKDSRCVFSALNCVKLQRRPSEYPSASRITIRLAIELVGKPYDLPALSNLQRKLSEHPYASRMVNQLALELVSKPYELPASSDVSWLTIRLVDGYSKEHPSASRIVMRLAIELAGKSYDLSASSNASRITKRLADGCSEGPRCVFSALDYVKSQRKPFKHPSTSRLVVRFVLELACKSYDKWLADGCSKDPRCVFSALNCVKLQRGPFEHPSASRITIRLALELDNKPYELPASFNVSRLTIRLADGCSKGARQNGVAAFSALDCIKLQRGPSEHPSASRKIMRFAIEFVGKPYDLSTNSNASRITKPLADECSKGPRCVFSTLDYVKSQRGPFKYPSASHLVIRLALYLAGKSYNLFASSNASRITKRLADGCSKCPHCVFSALNCIKLQRGPSDHPSASRITIRLALELVNKPFDLPASSNASRLTIQLAVGCSKSLRFDF